MLFHLLVSLIPRSEPRGFLQLAVGIVHAWVLLYALLLAIGFGIQYFRRATERELRMAHLEGQLARAQLQSLKMELHPHFLFNALNSISALMHRDVRAADRMLSRLQDLFRLTLEKNAAHEVPLRDELEILTPYLEIEQTRYGDRLLIDWQVDADVIDAAVPQLILQPLIENAIKHGVAPRSSRGLVRIAAFRDGDDLWLEIEDSGGGFRTVARPADGRSGVGLLNTRARLDKLYDGRHWLGITTGQLGGARVRIRLPFRIQP